MIHASTYTTQFGCYLRTEKNPRCPAGVFFITTSPLSLVAGIPMDTFAKPLVNSATVNVREKDQVQFCLRSVEAMYDHVATKEEAYFFHNRKRNKFAPPAKDQARILPTRKK